MKCKNNRRNKRARQAAQLKKKLKKDMKGPNLSTIPNDVRLLAWQEN
jgi:hypothetical protein